MAEPSWPALAFVAFLVAQRLGELALSRRNTARLLASGAREAGAGHYPAMVAMHVAWLAAIAVFGAGQPVHVGWLAVFAGLQLMRVWVIATLGPRWTTRIIVADGPLVLDGPFRYLRHPNYAVVTAEIAVAPLVLGLWPVAVVFTLLNAAMLRVRIRAEDTALGRE